MKRFYLSITRALVLFAGLCAMLLAHVASAHAQSATCARLQQSLAQAGSTNSRGLEANARNLGQAVQQAESRYIRNGCNDDARAGRTLSPQCQTIAREVLRLRDQYAEAARVLQSGNVVAQQREAVLQEMARFGCHSNSGASFSNDRQQVFDRIFGTTTDPDFSDGQLVENYDYWGYGGSSTVRSVCVRLSDGYFWPVSYSTLPDYLGNDAMTCQQMCPGEAVDLYFYDNPGQEPEQMRNLVGQPYTALPSAFRYREQFDTETNCRAPSSGGRINVAASESGTSRVMIEYEGQSFPMPLRDPRGQSSVPIEMAALETPQFVDVPLPRRRPAGPGEAPLARPVTTATQQPGLRLVQFGDRVVRVVGPDTPYARSGEAGS